MLDADEIGRERQAVHSESKNRRLYEDTTVEHRRGAHGEKEFVDEFGYPLDRRKRKSGDDGFDFVTAMGLIDVKASIVPSLAVKTYEIHRRVDIYVFAHYNEITKTAKFLGWEYPEEMIKCPIEDLPYGPCYVKPAHALKSMEHFRIIMDRVEKSRSELTAKLKVANWPEVIYIWEDWLHGKI